MSEEIYLLVVVGSILNGNENLAFKNNKIVKYTGSMLELVVKEIKGNYFVLERNIIEKVLIK